MITHWDEVEGNRRERGHIAASWQALTGANSITVGVQRISVDAGRWATPLHLEGSEEEIFYVLSGTGVSFQVEGDDEQAFPVGAGDCLVHLALEHAHTIGAGDDGLVVLAFGQRHYAANTLLPRAGVSWLGPTWVLEGAPEDHPWAREAAVGAADLGPSSPSGRPRSSTSTTCPQSEHAAEQPSARRRGISASGRLGAHRALTHYVVPPGKLMNPPHVHSAEEEIFVVLEGERHAAALSEPALDGGELEEFPIRAGCTIARPAGTRRAHAIGAGDDGLTVLAYGTRDPNDIVYYPRSGKISFRGVGVIGRLEQVDYWDGED